MTNVLQVWSMFNMFPLLNLNHSHLLWQRAENTTERGEHHGLPPPPASAAGLPQ